MSPVEVSVNETRSGAVPVVGLKEKLACGGAGAVTVTTIDLLPVPPWLSVTEAVIVCDPADNELGLIDAPLPRAPSWLDVHWMLPDKSPSSVSLAVPVIETASPNWENAPFPGAVIDTVGAAFTVIETDWVAVLPPLSVTDA